jgi:L-asparagine oxygenase
MANAQVSEGVRLSDSESKHLAEVAARLSEVIDENHSTLCGAAASLIGELPDRLGETLEEFGNSGRPEGCLLLGNLPTGDVPATPTVRGESRGRNTLLAAAQAIIAEAIGHLVTYQAQNGRVFFEDLAPLEQQARLQTSMSNEVELEIHTELSFSPLRPDYLLLGCLRQHLAAKTYTFGVANLTEVASGHCLSVLSQKRWMTGVDTAIRRSGYSLELGLRRGPVSVLQLHGARPAVTFDNILMESDDVEAAWAVDELMSTYLQRRRTHILHDGEVLILENNHVMHGRSAFPATHSGSGRFLTRSCAVKDLRKVEHALAPGTRMVLADFT